ncbi:hypothetical protein LOTGIDRAFT_191516 [Lottia gigantea]|uniref:Major facilitator superfamily (MFS) profile domain-containing protein n=1 Tax=Lottia gigantea TaxID=225164 RepID=V4A7M7_LOTGI|nr:hypothetical protein LOTGIDRAFT_191516 [Lottia gigantea]ESO91025.1 hypothetical protein LOTGIDRAFT_191516 [Lottia gigantea]
MASLNNENERLLQNDDGDENFYDESSSPTFNQDYQQSPSRPRHVEGLYTYEEGISQTGYGKFHVFLVLLCGWAVSSDAVEVLSVSFLIPSASCSNDLNLSSSDKGWLNAIVFVGMMVGGYFWGSLADSVGRRSVLMWSLSLNGIGALLSSTSQVFWLFLLFRLISGIGVGGSIPVIFTYFVEFQPKNKRGGMISLLATFWMGGNILAAGLAWLIVPHENFGYSSPSFLYNSWRIFVAFCTIPSFTSAAIFFIMPESPKFLLQKGKEIDAIHVLKRIHHQNKHRNQFTTPLTEQLTVFIVDRHHFTEQLPLFILLSTTLRLFHKDLRRQTIILIIINFTLSFGYYGLFMWFPELFNRIDKYGGTPCDPGLINSTLNTTTDNSCHPPTNWVFFAGFMTALSNLPANIFTIFCMDRLGRKYLLASSMVLSGICVFFIWFVRTKVENLIMSCLFGLVSTVGWNSLDVLSAELFPTEVRSTGFGVQQAFARVGAILGNVIFGELLDVHCAIPMLLVAALLAFGGLSSLKLPNTAEIDIH